jgi:hypothetical protein
MPFMTFPTGVIMFLMCTGNIAYCTSMLTQTSIRAGNKVPNGVL